MNWLMQMRTKQHMTQEQVAEMSGIERSYYTKIENGQTPSVKVAKKIADVLGFQWTIFFNNVGDEKAQ